MNKDYSKNNKCKDCFKLITNYAFRCKKCAMKITGLAKMGKILSIVTRLKMSKARKGRKFSIEHKRNLSKACKNRTITTKTRRKISNTLKGRPLIENNHKTNCSCSFCRAKRKELIKEENPNWQGGISYLPYSSEFTFKLKNTIIRRDNCECQLCYISRKKHLIKYLRDLICHHIDYNKLNCKEDNLITLCCKCNAKVNFNRDYWFAYFKYKENLCQN